MHQPTPFSKCECAVSSMCVTYISGEENTPFSKLKYTNSLIGVLFETFEDKCFEFCSNVFSIFAQISFTHKKGIRLA